jgi:hypothetical protein
MISRGMCVTIAIPETLFRPPIEPDEADLWVLSALAPVLPDLAPADPVQIETV